MLKVPAMILGVKGPSNQHCIGGGGGMRKFAVFLRKCPKTFGQDCIFSVIMYLEVHVYRKIPIVSPGIIIVPKASLLYLFSGELIF